MTAEEIKKARPGENCNEADGAEICWWLKEIAYQLALLNEERGGKNGKSVKVSA